MTKRSILTRLHFDEVQFIKNPYFYIREYEDKGVLVLIKKDKDADLNYLDLQNICFECPNLENHKGIIRMVLFSLDKNNKIVNYSIASSKYKILRSDIIKYEALIDESVEVK